MMYLFFISMAVRVSHPMIPRSLPPPHPHLPPSLPGPLGGSRPPQVLGTAEMLRSGAASRQLSILLASRMFGGPEGLAGAARTLTRSQALLLLLCSYETHIRKGREGR